MRSLQRFHRRDGVGDDHHSAPHGAGGFSIGPNQTLSRGYRFKCTTCRGEFLVPDGQTTLSLGALAFLGLVVIIGGLTQGLWFAAPMGLMLGVPLALALYQRQKHPGMF